MTQRKRIWTDKHGTKYRYSKMTIEHLRNALCTSIKAAPLSPHVLSLIDELCSRGYFGFKVNWEDEGTGWDVPEVFNESRDYW